MCGMSLANTQWEGYDDALEAMRRVHEKREWLIGVIKGRFRIAGDGRWQKNSVTNRFAPCRQRDHGLRYPARGLRSQDLRLFHKAAPMAALIHEASEGPSASGPATTQRNTTRQFGRDLCIDWMLAALACRDRLAVFVSNASAQIEKRDWRSRPADLEPDAEDIASASSRGDSDDTGERIPETG